MDKNIIRHLESLPFFSKNAFLVFEKIKQKALYENIQRWVKGGNLLRLKNGLYVTKTYVDRFLHDRSFVELIANKLVIPSYLSLEYVLQKNGLLTEATFTITSVTLKTTRHYANNLGSFVYHHLNQKLYFGFRKRPYGQNVIFEASPAKALFDFLYLRKAGLDPKNRISLDALRINWNFLDGKSFNELQEIITRSNVQKMQNMMPLLKEVFRGNSHQ